MKTSREMKKKFALINVLSKLEKPSLLDFHRATKIPQSTIKRQLAALRKEFGMQILFIREPTNEKGRKGYYMLIDWGIIDRATFLTMYSHIEGIRPLENKPSDT